MYINRHLESEIVNASKYYPVLMVCGQRQVGKSTMLSHIKENDRRYVTFDDANARLLAKNDPALFFETYGYKLLIDEFQREPSILLEMKKIIDERALKGIDNNGMFWLTGSQKFKMMKDVSESLAGRIGVFDLSSLSQSEIEGKEKRFINFNINELKQRPYVKKNIHEIFEAIYKGGMPKIITTDIDRNRYYMDYVNTYLERDVKDFAQIGKIDEFYNFIVFMAANTAQELKYDTISKAIGVSVPTIKAWVTILERSGIIYILKPYANKITDRLIKTPKVYFMDTGLAAYLTKWPNAETLESGSSAGAFFETYVVSELIKNYYNNGKEINLYYYRDIDKKEIDLLAVDASSIYPIEIKKNKNPSEPDKNLSVLNKFKLEVKPMVVFCMSDEILPINRNSWLAPIEII